MTSKIKIDKNINIEDAFNQLSDIVNEIEQDNLTLDKTMELFEKGMLLTKICQKKIKKAEEKVKLLLDDNKII
tara:strand:+ start:11974 stop:12192 length:219 start_codon:yes stop_codon:yes gene_type:complete